MKRKLGLALMSAVAWVMNGVMRAYGAMFVGLGALFLYWAGRGLLAYQNGVRAAWADPLACAAGLVAGILSFWIGFRVMRGELKLPRERGITPELQDTLDRVMELDKTDPAAANQLLDSYFMREAEVEQRQLAELRQRAPDDIKAATELRRKLEESLKASASARKEFANDVEEPKRSELLAQMDSNDRDLEAELGQLDATITRLRLK